MEKLNVLLGLLNDYLAFPYARSKEAKSLIRALKSLHGKPASYEKLVARLDAFACLIQNDQLPHLFFLKFVGSLNEFENECVQLRRLIG